MLHNNLLYLNELKPFINNKYRSLKNLLAFTMIPQLTQIKFTNIHTTYKLLEITNMYV